MSQIARNLFQYFAADVEIVTSKVINPLYTGNVIKVAIGTEDFTSIRKRHPIQLKSSEGILIRDVYGKWKLHPFEAGLGAIFLEPLPDERLRLVIWGFDASGLRIAARLLPMLTGVGQPDFVIVSNKSRWRGAGGALAMGHFDHNWDISMASFLS